MKKLKLSCCTSAVWVGVLLFIYLCGLLFCGFTLSPNTVAKGVTVNGVKVGGIPQKQAIALLRKGIEGRLCAKQLVISAPNNTYCYTYPQLTYHDDIPQTLANAKRGQSVQYHLTYHLKGLKTVMQTIAHDTQTVAQEPIVYFDGRFHYRDGWAGQRVDIPRLYADIQNALSVGEEQAFLPVKVAYIPQPTANTIDVLRQNTTPICTFTTHYDSQNIPRSHNIALACQKLHAVVLQPHAVFSFNQTVGERTEQAGFMSAKIISAGQYVQGIGGGVCQVSTTLYNATVMAGCKVVEYHPHSLSVGYVPPSQDAMVSGNYYDLKVQNPYDTPLYISLSTANGQVSCTVYGKHVAPIKLQSEVVAYVPPPEPKEEWGEQEGEVPGKQGVESRCYAVYTIDGITVKKLLRTDTYAPTQGTIVHKKPLAPML